MEPDQTNYTSENEEYTEATSSAYTVVKWVIAGVAALAVAVALVVFKYYLDTQQAVPEPVEVSEEERKREQRARRFQMMAELDFGSTTVRTAEQKERRLEQMEEFSVDTPESGSDETSAAVRSERAQSRLEMMNEF